MSKYFEYQIPLSDNQLQKLQTAINNKKNVTLQLSKKDINSNVNAKKVLLTRTQINKIEKHRSTNKGVEITFSQAQLKKNQTGGMIPLLPILAKLGSIAAPLAISAVSGLVNSAANALGNKLVGNGVKENMNLDIPKNDLVQIIRLIDVLENKNILPGGSKSATEKNIEQNGGAFVLPLIASLLGTFLPTLFRDPPKEELSMRLPATFQKGNGVYLPWESKN